MVDIAPLRGPGRGDRPWQGSCSRKPWEYRVTVAIPHFESPECLEVIVRLHQRQSLRPFVVVVDTGSAPDALARVLQLRGPDVEVHSIACNGYEHASDPVAIAMDLAQSRCCTPFLFATHADCFPRSRDLLKTWVGACESGWDVVGYQMSPRVAGNWQQMPSHTATCYSVAYLDKIGSGWSMRRWENRDGTWKTRCRQAVVGWPDTETLMGDCLLAARARWFCVGAETNGNRHVDQWIDHCRSHIGHWLYNEGMYRQSSAWIQAALAEARSRLADWPEVIF
jgi:hypothetical protein